ncbi:MAG: cytochrome c [Candidatus Korobacteraceae bacterium]|jgi:cytochrome c553
MKKVLFSILALAVAVPAAFAADLASDANYKAKCAVCHGANAEGKPAMKVAPLKSAAGKSTAELTATIENGTTTTPKMSAFKGKLTDAEIKTLVAEIQALK